MKETNSSGKNIAILAVSVIASVAVYKLAKFLLWRIIDKSQSPKMQMITLDATTSQPKEQKAKQEDDEVIAPPRIVIKIDSGKSGMFNEVMEIFFAICATNGSKGIAQSLGKVVNLHTKPKEHSEPFLVKFLQNVYNTKTAAQVSQLLIQAEELEIFLAFIKAFEKVEEKDFQKVVTTLVQEDAKPSQQILHFLQDLNSGASLQKAALKGAKLTLFTKLIHSLDSINTNQLKGICAMLQYTNPEKITEFANDLSKTDLASLVILMEKSAAQDYVVSQTNTFMKTATDASQIFNLSINSLEHSTIRIGSQSQDLSKITGKKILEAKESGQAASSQDMMLGCKVMDESERASSTTSEGAEDTTVCIGQNAQVD